MATPPSGPIPKKSVLFVCLGNICRSPIAEAIFRHHISALGLEDEWGADSCGLIDYHSGKRPDARARKVIQERGLQYEHKARVFRGDVDYYKFDYIFGMDRSNTTDLDTYKPEDAPARIHMLGEFDPLNQVVPKEVRDPYYDTGSDKGFSDCFDHCLRCIEGFIKTVVQKSEQPESEQN